MASRQGLHQVPQMSITTTFPLNWSSDRGLPSRSLTLKSNEKSRGLSMKFLTRARAAARFASSMVLSEVLYFGVATSDAIASSLAIFSKGSKPTS